MKFLLTLFTLFFSYSVFSEDISDFEIEGISIGDSLLDYFSETEIKASEVNYYNNNDIIPIYVKDKIKFKTYTGVQFHYKSNDKNFEIMSIEGVLLFEDNFDECLQKKKEIDNQFKPFFKNAKRVVTGSLSHPQDKSGKSKFDAVFYDFQNGDKVTITCFNWTEEMGYKDNLRVGIVTFELQTWINNKAYN